MGIITCKTFTDRRNIVITRNDIDGIDCFRSIDDALQSCEGNVWFIGGSGIYEEAMDKAEIIEMTLVPDKITGNNCVYFPDVGKEWEKKPVEKFKGETKLRLQKYTRRV